MKIKIIYNFWFLPKAYSAITIYPYICVSGSKISEITFRHELEHCYQVRQIGWISFYISYLLYFMAGLIRRKNWNEAYLSIPYEKLAYDIQETPLTIEERELYATKKIKV